VNKKSELGRKPLNAVLQNLLNCDGEQVKGNPFRVGDKIINTKNGQYKWATEPQGCDPLSALDEKPGGAPTETCYVANGEQAEVLSVEPGVMIARLTSPDRTIIIPRSVKAEGDESGGGPSGGDDDSEAAGTGCNWELGYAISCHKSQGSEWPIVVVMLDDHNSAKRVCSRQWIYTGISRAKTLCILIGRNVRAQEMCGVDSLFKRKTFLRESIVELREAADAAERNRVLQEWAEDVIGGILAGVY
jgi:ATP-dependent exoDNAse (exonuclease V) alpha subunit